MGLYWIGDRWYDPDIGQFVSPCNIQDLVYNIFDVGNYNRYSLGICHLYFPPSGFNLFPWLPLVAEEWKDPRKPWQINFSNWYGGLHWGWKVGIGAGLFLVGLGLTVLTGGAALPFVIKFGIGVAVGTAIGTGINLAMGADFGDALLGGFADSVLISGVFSFGSGAIRAGRYGYAYATKNAEIMAKLFTHNKYAGSYMLGKWDGGGPTGYIAQAKAGGHTYFAMPKRIYTSVNARFADAWSVNQAFLVQQAGKTLWVSHSLAAATNTFWREIEFLLLLGM